MNQGVAPSTSDEIVGNSPAIQKVRTEIDEFAPHPDPVLVTGATGTGKELVARSLHRSSRVRSGPFVTCNCAAIPLELLESELFGHVKGAFTGADANKKGFFEQAQAGTLFLDEIGELDLRLQPKLLRALDQQEIQPVGASRPRRSDVRIVAATNQDLDDLVRQKRFREDLLFRFVFQIELPRLIDRTGDLEALVEHTLRKLALNSEMPKQQLTPAAWHLFRAHSWPGNVRELESTVKYAVAKAGHAPVIDSENLPVRIRSRRTGVPAVHPVLNDRQLSMADMNREYARLVVRDCSGNRSEAARKLGINRTTLYKLLREDDVAKRE